MAPQAPVQMKHTLSSLVSAVKLARKISPEQKERNRKRHEALREMELEKIASALAPKVEGRIVQLDAEVGA